MRTTALLTLLFAAGCNASCDQACDKLVDCGQVNNDGQSQEECAEVCLGQDDLYTEIWEDESLEQAAQDNRDCIRDATCDALADGACYDEELFAW